MLYFNCIKEYFEFFVQKRKYIILSLKERMRQMKKIFLILNGAILLIKEWCVNHKKLLKRFVIGCMSLVSLAIVSIIALYIYFSYKYPSEIVLDGVYTDLSIMNFEFTDRDVDGTYETAEATKINAMNGQINIDGEGVVLVEENIVLSAEGTYILSGDFSACMLLVEAGESDKVQVVLDNCTINNEEGPAFYIKSADKVFITLAEGTTNTIVDGKEYEYTDGETNVDAAVYSKADLTINGNGTLLV